MSVAKLRFFDILILTSIALLIDTVVGLSGFLAIQLYFSIGIPIVLLVYIRWGIYGMIPNVILILLHLIIHFVSWPVMAAHTIGLMILFLAVFFVKWEKLRRRPIEFHNVFFYYSTFYILMITVEIASLYLFNSGVSIGGFYLNHSMNYFIGLGLLFIISKQKDLLVNMDTYLREESEGTEEL